LAGWLVSWLRGIELSPRLREELIAFAVFTLAVVTALPLVGLSGDSALSLLGEALYGLLGLAAGVVPIALSIVAVEVWRAGEAGQRARRTVGGFVSVAAVVGFLALAHLDNAVSENGGVVGYGIARGIAAVLGEVGAGLTLLALGVIGVFLVTGADTRSIAESWARVRPRRDDVFEADEDELPVSVSTGTEQFQPGVRTSTGALPVITAASPGVAVPAPRAAPVINVPQPERGAAEVRKAAQAIEEGQKAQAAPDGKRGAWKLPPLGMLTLYESAAPNQPELEAKARRIEESLLSFKVEASVREIFPGPAVTLFTLEPGPGVKVRRITELQNDLALALAAVSIRIEAPVPGMARVGVEIPNGSISTVGLRETLESNAFKKLNAKLPLSFGRDVNGRYIVGDLAKMPHLLIAGSTGSGKSVCVNGIIATWLLTKSPDDLKIIMIDPKMVEMAGYEGVPHLKAPVVTEMPKVVPTLRMVLREMERRYQLFSRLGVRNIDGYDLRRTTEPKMEKLPYLVVIIDELADLMMTAPDEVETLLVRLAQMARATGIHLLIATQRPSVDVLTGLIKANVPARIAFAVTSQVDSRVILDMPGAERLLGRGDMLFMPADAAKPSRIQGSYIDDSDLQQIVKHWRLLTPEMQYDPEWVELPGADGDGDGENDPLLEQALEIVRQQGTASASMLQRRLRIGYNRAARIIEAMEEEGVIGPADGGRGRQLIVRDEWDG
jgi:S-DNA-T family DNA segregation ATPase FtsK/SpoIIIE